jgi:hypothetical protein
MAQALLGFAADALDAMQERESGEQSQSGRRPVDEEKSEQLSAASRRRLRAPGYPPRS